MRKRFPWLAQFNWRMLLMRIVINAISLVVVAILVPDIYFAEKSIRVLLAVSIGLGIINALIKPLIQFLTFQLIFASFGIVIILINSLLLWLLGRFFSEWFVVNSVFWAFVGGALLGGLGSFLEALFGLTLPIVSTEDHETRALLRGEKIDVFQTILKRTQPDQQDEGLPGVVDASAVDAAAVEADSPAFESVAEVEAAEPAQPGTGQGVKFQDTTTTYET